MNVLAKLALGVFAVAFALAFAAACAAAYRSECACARAGRAGREGMEGAAAALSSAEYYTLSSLVAQIEKDDPDFEYAFDVSAVLQVGAAHAAYAAVLNGDASVGDKIAGVKALLEEEPVKQYMDLAFTTPPPDAI